MTEPSATIEGVPTWVEQLQKTGTFVIPADIDMTIGELDDIFHAAGMGQCASVIEPVADDGTIKISVRR